MAIIPGLMTYSYHLSFPEGKMTAERLMDRVEELGLRSTEWCHFPCHGPHAVDWDQVKLLDRLGRRKGIRNSIAGFGPLLAEGARREELLAMVRTQIEVSKFIGSSRLRFGGMSDIELGIGVPPPRDPCLDNLQRVVELGEKAGVVIALEDHMDFRAADFRYFFSEIDSPYLAVNLDTGNLMPLQEDAVAFAEEFADRIVSCHFKGVRYVWEDYGAVLTSGPPERSLVDLHAILGILAGQERDIPCHIEVVAMKSDDEDVLVGEYARFLRDFLDAAGDASRCLTDNEPN